ncbi:MAG: hypothetical protein WB392_08285 [Methanotrichaceae archaeon]
MRIKISTLLSSLALVALLATLANSADWNNYDSGGLSADQLISGGDQGTYEPYGTGPAMTPQQERATEWANKTGPDFTMPSTLSDNAMSAKDSRNEAESATTAQESNTNQTTETAQVTQTMQASPSSTAAGNVSGSWSFELSDNTVKNVALTLFQSGDSVFGTGSMNDGNSTQTVAASGSLDDNKLNLDLTTTSGAINLYRLALTPSGDSASGDYQAFTASGSSLTGSANGTRSSQ